MFTVSQYTNDTCESNKLITKRPGCSGPTISVLVVTPRTLEPNISVPVQKIIMVCYCIIQVPDIHVYNVDISDWDKTCHVVQSYKPTG